MRVLYSFPHALGRPGIGTTAWYQVRGLIEQGHDVTVLCTSLARPMAGATVVESMRLARVRLPHRAFGSMPRAYAWHDRTVARHLTRHAAAERFDVVHVWPRACLVTARRARELGIPTVREAPNAHTAETLARVREAWGAVGLRPPPEHSAAWDEDLLRLEEAEFGAVDGILVPSDHVRESFRRRGYAEHRLLRTQYGYDPERFVPRPGDATAPVGGGGLRAVFAGRGEPAKGLHVALEAWLASPAAGTGRLEIVGRIWPPYEKLLGDRVHHPSVVVRGFVEDVPAVLADADVLLLPTWTEGSALVTYEAIGSGCVPLVSTAAGAPVTHALDGLLHDVGDVSTLAAQLTEVAGSGDRLAALRAAGLASRERLTWRAAAQRLAQAYARAAESVRS